MPFDWLTPRVPAAVRARDPERRARSAESDVRARAALLQRLGYEQSYALHRALGNQAWAYEAGGEAPLSDDAVRAAVADVYTKKPGA